MSDMHEDSTRESEQSGRGLRQMRTGRLEAFSDGVFAIAITLLVLNIAVPPTPSSQHDLLRAFFHQWPSYLGYIVSFCTIGAVWLGHSVITEFVERADANFVRLNLLLLLVVSLLPFPTRLLAEYIPSDRAERVAATIYGLMLLLTVSVLYVLWRYAVGQHLVRPDVADDELETLTRRLTPGLAGYVSLLILGLFLPVVAVFGYLLLALYILSPFRRRNRPRSRAR